MPVVVDAKDVYDKGNSDTSEEFSFHPGLDESAASQAQHRPEVDFDREHVGCRRYQGHGLVPRS